MQITNEEKTSIIEIDKLEEEKEQYPSYQLAVKIKTEKIEGTFDDFIWISETDLDTFVADLNKLYEFRKDKALLSSISPEEFRLEFSPIDSAGHVSVNIAISHKSLKERAYEIRVAFQIDSTQLPTIISHFKKIKEQNFY